MAGTITLPRAPNTGVGRLGDVIYASAAEYANTRRADEREARLRAQRLADVESDRGYARTEGDRQFDRGRTNQLTDVADARTYARTEGDRNRENRLIDEQARIRAQMLNLLVPRYLSPAQLGDATAVAAAFELAKRDGIIASDPLVKAAMESGVVFSAVDFATPEGLSAKLAPYSEGLAARRRLADAQPAEAASIIAQKEGELSALRKRSLALDQLLSASEPRPDPVAVENLARQLALANNPKASSADIANAMGEAKRQLSSDLFMQWDQARRDAMIQRQIMEAEGRQLSAELNTLRGTFRVAGGGLLTGTQRPAPTQSTLSEDVWPDDGSMPSVSAAPAPVQPPTLEQTQQNFRAKVTPPRPMGGAAGNYGPAPVSAPAAKVPPPPGIQPVSPTFSDPDASGVFNVGSTREAEDLILATSPDSPEAYEIRRRRGLPPRLRLGDVDSSTHPPPSWSSQLGPR